MNSTIDNPALRELRKYNHDTNLNLIRDQYLRQDWDIVYFDEGTVEIAITSKELFNVLMVAEERYLYEDLGGREPINHGALASALYVFWWRFFDEIRDRVCVGGKSDSAIGPTASASIAALTHWIAGRFQIEAETAKALATGVLITIASATKGAFCKMTANEAKEIATRTKPHFNQVKHRNASDQKSHKG
jgi:hypothetical protein